MNNHELKRSTWQQALTRNDDNRYSIEKYWQEAHDLATGEFKWRYKGGHLGNWMMFALDGHPVDQVSVWAVTREFCTKHGVQLEGDPDEVVEVQIRYSQPKVAPPPAGQALRWKSWQGVNGRGRSNGKRFVRILVDASRWNDAGTHDQKSTVLTEAFVAGLRMFEGLTGLKLPGADEAR